MKRIASQKNLYLFPRHPKDKKNCAGTRKDLPYEVSNLQNSRKIVRLFECDVVSATVDVNNITIIVCVTFRETDTKEFLIAIISPKTNPTRKRQLSVFNFPVEGNKIGVSKSS